MSDPTDEEIELHAQRIFERENPTATWDGIGGPLKQIWCDTACSDLLTVLPTYHNRILNDLADTLDAVTVPLPDPTDDSYHYWRGYSEAINETVAALRATAAKTQPAPPPQ